MYSTGGEGGADGEGPAHRVQEPDTQPETSPVACDVALNQRALSNDRLLI